MRLRTVDRTLSASDEIPPRASHPNGAGEERGQKTSPWGVPTQNGGAERSSTRAEGRKVQQETKSETEGLEITEKILLFESEIIFKVKLFEFKK